MTYLAILGRQPALSLAELEQVFGSEHVAPFSAATATVEASHFDIQMLGGTTKAGRVVMRFKAASWQEANKKITAHYYEQWRSLERKQTLGVSLYDWRVSKKDLQRLGLGLKSSLKARGVSLRIIPNTDVALNSAVSHHNKLGLRDNKTELLIVRGPRGDVFVAESVGAQNITALAARDQGRPKRDAFVGMLPPKLALIMVNLSGLGGAHPSGLLRNEFEASPPPPKARSARANAEEPLATSFSGGPNTEHSKRGVSGTFIGEDGSYTVEPLAASFSEDSAFPAGASQESQQVAASVSSEKDGSEKARANTRARILDPFCGTGVVLQEALLRGFDAYGTDLSEKMVDYSRANLAWLTDTHRITGSFVVEHGDAMDTQWQPPIDAVVGETYLGQPFSAPPNAAKLDQVSGNCDHIISTFLKNLAPQLKSGTPLCLAVPAWRDAQGHVTHLPLLHSLGELGYRRVTFANLRDEDLLYYREDQVVARELLVLTRR